MPLCKFPPIRVNHVGIAQGCDEDVIVIDMEPTKTPEEGLKLEFGRYKAEASGRYIVMAPLLFTAAMVIIAGVNVSA